MKNPPIPDDSDKPAEPVKSAKPTEPTEPTELTDQAKLIDEKRKAIIHEIGREYWDLLEKMADE